MFKFIVISLIIVSSKQQEISTNHNSIDNSRYDIICDHCSTQNNETDIITTDTLRNGEQNIPLFFLLRTPKNSNNSCGSSADDFPNFFTPEERKHGAILIHIVGVFYCFALVAMICDNYFIPCVEQISIALNLSEDVAAATFMSIATSAPELFVNIIGTFITKSDIGIGTIVGSSMFNTLGVASVGGLAAAAPIQLAWWPLCRDVTLYICAVFALVLMTWDGNIFWYEALCLFLAYFIYFAVMFQNDRISSYVYAFVEKFQRKSSLIEEEPKMFVEPEYKISINIIDQPRSKYVDPPSTVCDQETSLTISEERNLYRLPKGTIYKKLYFLFTWPLRFALYWTVPDPKKLPRLFPVTFVMCIVWIGCNSYIASWLMSIIGYTFGIPDAVLGLTFLGAVGCLGEVFSIAIMSRKGEGKMGVSNALGANTMNILLSLGLPWFIQTLVLGADDDAFIAIESGSMEYTILGLIVVSISLVVTLGVNKFKLSRVTGCITLFFYLCFLSVAIVADMVIFPRDCQ